VCDVHGSPVDCDYSAAQGLLKIKDAIVDRIREKRGNRPDVDKDNPTHQIEFFFWKGKVDVSIDLSGEPMHRRGYRKQHGGAPLRESRAAALLRMANIQNANFEYLMDPFCGSGTIAIEAAMMLRKIPPANRRYIPKKSFIPNFQKDYLAKLSELRAGILESTPIQILGGDIDSSVIPRARKAAATAGVENDIQFEVIAFEEIDFKVNAPTILVSNPPYGERLEDEYEAKQILIKLGNKIKFESDVEKMVLLVPKGMETTVGLKPSKKVFWKAGPLDLVATTYDLWKGPKKNPS
jgi:23S rRNA G2445 N2-methylase RlmL